jgi:hypothetical protein
VGGPEDERDVLPKAAAMHLISRKGDAILLTYASRAHAHAGLSRCPVKEGERGRDERAKYNGEPF